LRAARSQQLSLEIRAADYLQAAALTAPDLGSGTQPTPALNTYNSATAELTILLRSAQGGRLWNHPLTLTAKNTTYHLRLQPAGNAVWSPDYFTSFIPAAQIKEKLIKKESQQSGVSGFGDKISSLYCLASLPACVDQDLDHNKYDEQYNGDPNERVD